MLVASTGIVLARIRDRTGVSVDGPRSCRACDDRVYLTGPASWMILRSSSTQASLPASYLPHDAPMTVIHIHRERTEYQVVCTTARTDVEVPIPCRTRDELVAVLHALGVDHAGLADVFNQLDSSPDAEVRV